MTIDESLDRVDAFVTALECYGHGTAIVSCRYGHEAHWPGPDGEYVPLRAGDLRDLVDQLRAWQTPPCPVTVDASDVSEEDMQAWREAFDAEIAANRRPTWRVVPISAFVLRRRTPAERRVWLLEHRDDAIERGIPADLIDMMITDGERGRVEP